VLLFGIAGRFTDNKSRIVKHRDGRKEKKAGAVNKYPSDFEWIKRTYPFFNSDPLAYKRAIEETQRLRFRTEIDYLKKGAWLSQWEFVGPVNIGGRIVDIEFNPKYPDIVYAGAATGGVLKSTDMGRTWRAVFDEQATLTIGDIAVDPNNPDIIYVGTGEANGGHNNFPGGGIYKSLNGGNTWSYVGLDSSVSIGRVIIDPVNSNNIYVAAVGSYFAPNSQRGVYKSTDGGQSWQRSLFVSDSTGAIDIIMDPVNPSFLMVAMWERVRRPSSAHLYGPSSGIYRSTDAGKSWSLLGSSTGLPNSLVQNVGRIGLAQSRTNPAIIYALYTDGYFVTGLYKTSDYGNSWSRMDPLNKITSGTSNFSWYFGQLRVHPVNPDIVYVMDVAFMRSSDGQYLADFIWI